MKSIVGDSDVMKITGAMDTNTKLTLMSSVVSTVVLDSTVQVSDAPAAVHPEGLPAVGVLNCDFVGVWPKGGAVGPAGQGGRRRAVDVFERPGDSDGG